MKTLKNIKVGDKIFVLFDNTILADPVAFKTWVRRLVRRDKRYLKEVAAEMNINETGLHDRFKRGFVNINDLIKLLDSLDMDLIIRDRRYNR